MCCAELLRRTMRVVARRRRPQSRPAGDRRAIAGPGGTGLARRSRPARAAGAPERPARQRRRAATRSRDRAAAARGSVSRVWPDPNDFASAAHRAILEQLQAGPPWPDVATALAPSEAVLGPAVAAKPRTGAGPRPGERRVSPEEIAREYQVRRLELRKHRLIGQTQALCSALRRRRRGWALRRETSTTRADQSRGESVNEIIARATATRRGGHGVLEHPTGAGGPWWLTIRTAALSPVRCRWQIPSPRSSRTPTRRCMPPWPRHSIRTTS